MVADRSICAQFSLTDSELHYVVYRLCSYPGDAHTGRQTTGQQNFGLGSVLDLEIVIFVAHSIISVTEKGPAEHVWSPVLLRRTLYQIVSVDSFKKLLKTELFASY